MQDDNAINPDEFFDEELGGIDLEGVGKRIAEVFRATVKANENLEILKAQVEHEESIVNESKNKTLPELLALMGTEVWRDPETGLTVELKTSVNSSLPKDQAKRNEIFDALRPIGIEEILAEEFTVIFGPNDKRAHAIRAILGLEPQSVVEEDQEDHRLTNSQMELVYQLRTELGLESLPADEKLGAHPSTLKAWLKRRIDAGYGDRIRDAGIWHGKFAEIEKKSKVKK